MKTKPIPTPQNWQNLKPHPLSELTEFSAGIDIDGLAEHMQLHGYDPDESIILHDGMILDGRHKHAAAIIADVVPAFKQFIGVNAAAYVCKKAFRQHLDTSQRAMIAATLTKINAIKKRLLEEEPVGNPTGAMSQGQAAKSLNISRESVNNAVAVQDHGTERLQEAVKEGTVSVSDAAKVAHSDPTVQNQAVRDVQSGKAKTVTAAASVFCERCQRIGPVKDCQGCQALRENAGGRKAGGTKQGRPKPLKNGAEIVKWREVHAAFGVLVRVVDALYGAHGLLDARGYVLRDQPYEELSYHLSQYLKGLKKRFQELTNTKAPEY